MSHSIAEEAIRPTLQPANDASPSYDFDHAEDRGIPCIATVMQTSTKRGWVAKAEGILQVAKRTIKLSIALGGWCELTVARCIGRRADGQKERWGLC
ncbi:MAG TPA: hypothetical protein EYQ27_13570 [Gemmatimonadetes bacterium]|nr:hypothetical protein [Gemmatimonadota bacterium]